MLLQYAQRIHFFWVGNNTVDWYLPILDVGDHPSGHTLPHPLTDSRWEGRDRTRFGDQSYFHYSVVGQPALYSKGQLLLSRDSRWNSPCLSINGDVFNCVTTPVSSIPTDWFAFPVSEGERYRMVRIRYRNNRPGQLIREYKWSNSPYLWDSTSMPDDCYELECPSFSPDMIFRSNPEYLYRQLTLAAKNQGLDPGEATRSALANYTDQRSANQVNMAAFSLDMIRIPALASQTVEILSNPSIKNVANAYLVKKYAYDNLVRDTSHLAHFLEHYDRDYQITRGMAAGEFEFAGSPVTAEFHQKFYTSMVTTEVTELTDRFKTKIHDLWNQGSIITLENIWDMIPYSFVVDWFLPVSRVLSGIDDHAYFETIPFYSSCESTRFTRIGPADEILPLASTQVGWFGTVSEQIYSRRVLPRPTPPAFRLDIPSGLSTHWLEGAALVVQKR